MRRREGRTAIVTGSGQGIEEAIAVAMAGEYASVVVAELREDTAAAVRRRIEEEDGTALARSTACRRRPPSLPWCRPAGPLRPGRYPGQHSHTSTT